MKTNKLKKLVLFSLFIAGLISSLPAQEWVRYYYVDNPEQEGRAITSLPDGGFAVAGIAGNSLDDPNNQAFLIETAANGSINWVKWYTVNHPGAIEVSKIILSADEYTYYICGSSNNSSGEGTSFIMKINLYGELISTFLYPELDILQDFIETPDGGFILAGGVYDANSSTIHPYIAKTIRIDSSGATLWEEEYDDAMLIECILPVESDSYYIGGLRPSVNPDIAQVGFISKISEETGAIEWTYYDPSFYHNVGKLMKRNDGNIMMMGTYLEEPELNDFVLILSPEGDFVDMNILYNTGRTNHDFYYCESTDQIISSGTFLNDVTLNYQSTIFTPEGDEIEMLAFPSSLSTIGYGMNISNDGKLAATGVAWYNHQEHVLFILFEPVCTPTSTAEDITGEAIQLNISPNPVTTSCTFQLPELSEKAMLLSILNSKGNLVEQLNVNDRNTSWKRNDLPAGLYFYQLHDSYKTVASGKIILK